MAQTREGIAPQLAARLCGQAACRDEARVARRLDRKQVVDGAANAAAIELHHRLHALQAGDDLAVDANVADFIHDDGDPLLLQAMLHDVFEERGLAASQKAGQDIAADFNQYNSP